MVEPYAQRGGARLPPRQGRRKPGKRGTVSRRERWAGSTEREPPFRFQHGERRLQAIDDLPSSSEAAFVRDEIHRPGEVADLRSQLEQEQRIRVQAQEAAQHLAAAVAAEHQRRRRAEEAADHAIRQLEMFRTHRDLTLRGAMNGRPRHLWRRLRHALRG